MVSSQSFSDALLNRPRSGKIIRLLMDRYYSWVYMQGYAICLDIARRAIIQRDELKHEARNAAEEERKKIVKWLRHVDRLDEIPGAAIGMPKYNPLWDAASRIEKFNG